MAKTKMMRLALSTEIKMIGSKPPMVVGDNGPHIMTIGDLIVQIIPSLAERDDANAMRLWNIGLKIDDGEKKTIDLSALDFEMLYKKCKEGDRPIWAKANLKEAFDGAKEIKPKE